MKAALLSASYIAIGVTCSTQVNAQARQEAAAAQQAGSLLPPVQIDAPKPKQRKRTEAGRGGASTARRSAVARNTEKKPEVPVANRPGGFNSTAQLGAPPPAYAGGQVATGGRVGLLGNRSVFDTPYSMTSYTARQIQETQANSLVDVAIADPSIKSTAPRGSFFNQLSIRGFTTVTGDFLFDGLAGILPDQTYPAEFVERYEILKGPAVFLNGIALGGSIAGTVNVVPKRATDDPITQITGSFASQSLFGTHIDYGRRFGDQKEWGVRVNGVFKDGDSVVNDQEHRIGAAQLSTDYRGDRFRASLDLGYQNQHDTRALSATTLAPGLTSVPAAPKGDSNFLPPWIYISNENAYGLARAEYDLLNNVTLFAAAGGSTRYFNTVQASPLTVTNLAGDYTARPAHLLSPVTTFSSEAGIRANFLTGPISHKMVILGDYIDQTKKQDAFVGAPFLGNIYQPNNAPPPVFGTTNLGRNTNTQLPSVAVADTLSALDDRLQLTLGARNQRIATQTYSAATGLQTDGSDKDKTSPSVSLLVKPIEHLSLYAGYIEAFTQGPTAPSSASNPGIALPPIVSTSKEVGAKYDFGRLGMTLAFFEIEQPQAFIDPVTNIFGLNGTQRNRGIEYFMFGELFPGFRAIGGITLIDGKQVATIGHLTDGKTAIGVPATSVSMGLDYEIPSMPGVAVNGRVIYTSSQYVTADDTLQIPDWTRLDLGARYTFMSDKTRMTARFNVENVTGQAYWSSSANGLLSLGAPRTYLASLTVDLTPAPVPGQAQRPMRVK
jgi:iron complex outermembrane receptor protein